MKVDVNGVEVQVVQSGRREGDGEPHLFFIHGAGGDATLWEDQARFFETRYPVYRVNLPGHGGSGGTGEEEIAAYAGVVRAVIAGSLPEAPLVLIGHSMGGAVVLDIASDAPSRLKGIVLVGTGAKLGVTPIILKMLDENPESFYQTIDRSAFFKESPPAVRETVNRAIRACPPAVIAGDFRACDRFDIRDRLGRIRIPALILCGEADLLTPVKYSQFLKDQWSHAMLEIIPNAGHMVMKEAPDVMNRAMERFLEEIPTGL
jgi:pimeloyl-ACP methyl ester carboxylesterase